jgi:hypothetical protein
LIENEAKLSHSPRAVATSRSLVVHVYLVRLGKGSQDSETKWGGKLQQKCDAHILDFAESEMTTQGFKSVD